MHMCSYTGRKDSLWTIKLNENRLRTWHSEPHESIAWSSPPRSASANASPAIWTVRSAALLLLRQIAKSSYCFARGQPKSRLFTVGVLVCEKLKTTR